MIKNVNVLEAMNSASINLFEVGRPADGRKLDKARAAVSELVDRVDAYQSARKLMDDAMVDGINVQGALSGYMGAQVMLNAALARVKGSAE